MFTALVAALVAAGPGLVRGCAYGSTREASMSKEAAVRAMREARYNQRSAAPAATSKPASPKPATSKPARAAASRPAKAPAADPVAPVAPETPAAEGLCGHRSMNGRSCTREHGHAAKSHRYS